MLVLSHVLPWKKLLVLHALGQFSPWVSLGCESRCQQAAQKWYCKNIDDCAKLKHGCGALGLCALTLKNRFVWKYDPQNPSKSHGWSMLIIIFPLEYRHVFVFFDVFWMFLKGMNGWIMDKYLGLNTDDVWDETVWILANPWVFHCHVFWVFANC